MTKDEWMKRCATQFEKIAGQWLTSEECMEQARLCFDVEFAGEEFDESNEHFPEEVAVEELAEWVADDEGTP